MEGVVVELGQVKLELQLTQAALLVAMRQVEELTRKQEKEKDIFSDWPKLAPTCLKKMKRSKKRIHESDREEEEEEDDSVWLRIDGGRREGL